MPPALPRPPTWTCAFTTTVPPSSSAATRASCGDRAARPSGTGTPTWAKSDLPWNSKRSTSFLPSAFGDVFVDPRHDVRQGGPGREDLGEPRLFQRRDVLVGDDPPAEDDDVVGVPLPQ